MVVVGSKALSFHDLAAGKTFAERKAPAPETEGPGYSFTRAVRYFPDGTKLVTGESDTTALVWEVPARPKAATQLSDKERAAAWEALSTGDGAKGWAAVWALADDPGAVAFLGERLKPVEALPAKEFETLFAALNAEEFADRKAASEKLAGAGERAVGQLRDALRGDLSAEQRDAGGRLFDGWKATDRKTPTGERLRVMRAIASLELSGTEDARKLLTELASGAPDATTTREAKQALERIGRR